MKTLTINVTSIFDVIAEICQWLCLIRLDCEQAVWVSTGFTGKQTQVDCLEILSMWEGCLISFNKMLVSWQIIKRQALKRNKLQKLQKQLCPDTNCFQNCFVCRRYEQFKTDLLGDILSELKRKIITHGSPPSSD